LRVPHRRRAGIALVTIPPDVASFWRGFCATRTDDPSARFYEAFHFSDKEVFADELAALVVAGIKRATAALVWSFEAERKPLPKRGDLSVVTNWIGTPVCVIETLGIEIVPFSDVTEEFAATEGEGDGSLRQWRSDHWSYFSRECERMGWSLSESMPVVCERFAVVYRPPR
jgi:uncharacterized protein YhfF